MTKGRNLISMFEGFSSPGAMPEGLQAPVGEAPLLRSNVFAFQSEIDPIYLEYGIHEQKAGQPIVLPQQGQDSGYGLALAPWSETPIAVRFRSSGQSVGSSVFILRPGDVVFPSRSRPFSGFEWGLPFGWLGGGLASIAILPSPETDIGWGGVRRELLFQRFQTSILAAASLVNDAAMTGALKYNWPLRFPFVQQRREDATATYDQSGTPTLAVEPTRTQLILHATNGALANPATMRALIVRPKETTPAATYALYETIAQDITWEQWAQVGSPSNYLQLQQVEFSSGPLVSLGGDNTGVSGLILVGDSGALLAGLKVDVLRYGKL